MNAYTCTLRYLGNCGEPLCPWVGQCTEMRLTWGRDALGSLPSDETIIALGRTPISEPYVAAE